MRKLLLVHDERYLEGALRNVRELLCLESRLNGGKQVSDLLAVLLVPRQAIHEFLPPEQKHEWDCFDECNALFGSESVSLNERWTLVTLSHHALQEPRSRDSAVDAVIEAFQSLGIISDSETAIRVSASGELHRLPDKKHLLRGDQSFETIWPDTTESSQDGDYHPCRQRRLPN